MSKVGARLLLAAALASLVLAFALLWGFDYSWRLGPFRLRITEPLRSLVAAAILSLAALVPRRSRTAALLLVAACGAAALISYARTADAAWAPAGDIALIEAYTIHATNAELLLGPYSRFGWNHPGPLYFYLLAPFYAMSGYRSAGLSAGALVINLSALGILVWVCVRAAPQGFLAIAISAASVLFAVLTKEMLASQWNPHVLVFPTMAIVVVAAAVAAGRIRWLPILAALASFVVQTHLGLGPAVVALSGAATAAVALRAYLFRSSDATPRLWPTLNGTLWLLLLLWLLPLAQELSEPDGNLSRLWTFFGAEARPGQLWRTSFRTWSDMISAVLRSDVHVGWGSRYGPNPGPMSQFWAITETVAVVLIAVKAAREKDLFRGALAAMVLIASGLGLWSISQIEDDIYDHLVFWLAGIGALHLGLIADALIQLVPRAAAAAGTRQIAAACLLLFGIGAAAGFQDLRVIVSRSFRPRIEQLSVRRLADAIVPAFETNRVKRPLVTIDQPTWGIAAGVLLQLQKRHIPFLVDEGWWFMFGPPTRPPADRPATSTLIFAGPELAVRLGDQPGLEVLAQRDRVSIILAGRQP
jgi:hypothetical protein